MQSRMLRNLLEKKQLLYPALALLGPRQVGKTTLAKSFGTLYFDLEQERDRLKLDLQWDSLTQGSILLILDEAQSWPQLFPRLRGAIDQRPNEMGRFLLLGSVSPFLMKEVSEPLAGRLGLSELSPFLLPELPSFQGVSNLQNVWLRGGYPRGGVLQDPATLFPIWQKDYLDILVHRDLPQWGLAARPQVTARLLSLLAGLHGQQWNASQIASALGLSYHTINTYLDFLEGAYLVRRLPPFFANLQKRLTKTPKIYLRDSGLLHSLLRITSYEELLSNPLVGYSFEGFVIEQILSTLRTYGIDHEACYFRTSDGSSEADLMLLIGRDVWVIEIKLTSEPTAHHWAGIQKVAALIKTDCCMLISMTSQTEVHDTHISTHVEGAVQILLARYTP